MKKYIISLSVLLVAVPSLTSATLLGFVGQSITKTTSGFSTINDCKISDTDRGPYVVQVKKLEDAQAINNLYTSSWGRTANCDELQKHIDWGTPLTTLATWLNKDPKAVIGNCAYPVGTTKDAVQNLNNIYKEEAGRDMTCTEALFHLQGTTHDALRNWLVNIAPFNRSFQEWKSTFQLVEGATYRVTTKYGSSFWLVKNGQKHWVPDIATMFAWGLLYDDSIATGTWFGSTVPSGDTLQFQNAPYRVAIQNRFRGSGYGEMPENLEEAVSQYRNVYSHPDSLWYGYEEFRDGYCYKNAYCNL